MRAGASRGRRLVWWAVALVVGLAVLYLVIGNAALPSVARSLARSAGVEMSHGMMYTLYPGQVHVRDLRISDGDGGSFQVSFESADLRWDELDLTGGRLRAWAGDAVVTGPVEARLVLADPRPLARSLAIRGGTITGRDLAVARPGGGAGRAPVQLDVDVREGELSTVGGLAFSGDVRVRGDDAGVLFDVAGVDGALRWGLASLEGQPFTLGAAAARRPGVLLLDRVRFESGRIEARGALHERGARREGAFLVRRGRLETGVAVEGGKVSVTLDPGEGWLARRLGAMESPRAALPEPAR